MIVSRPRSEGAITGTAVCTAAEAVGDFVYISGPKVGPDYSVRTVDNGDTAKMPAVGVVIAKITSTRAVVQFQGEVGLFAGLTPGKIYWVGDTAQPTVSPPTPALPGDKKYLQSVGVALDSGIIKLMLEADLKVRVG